LPVDKWSADYFPGDIDQEQPNAAERTTNIEVTLK
jgi:hypothetical protein